MRGRHCFRKVNVCKVDADVSAPLSEPDAGAEVTGSSRHGEQGRGITTSDRFI